MSFWKNKLAVVLTNPILSFLFHYIIWILLYVLTGLPHLLANPATPNWDYFLFNYGVLGSINFMLFYPMAFYVIPKLFIREKNIPLLILIALVAALLFTFLKYKVEVWNFQIRMDQMRLKAALGGVLPNVPLGPPKLDAYMRSYVWFSLIIFLIAFSYQLILIWYKNEKIRKELENQKLQAELSFLKMQINPHFLFNALNNIYSIAILEKAKRSADNILKLSELIRYMLYEKEDEQYRVSLDKEINHINSFIDLQKLRHDGDTFIHFSIEGITADKKIPPLLLFPLIENSFKHGILQDVHKPVTIQLNLSEHKLHFSIYNFKNDFLKDHTGGIGIVNVQKRLTLLYPMKHHFIITETNQDFSVDLKLPL